MKISRQLQGIPDASAQAGASMSITRTEDGASVGSTLTDAEGIATIQTNGSPGPIKTTFIKGNTWRDDSRSIMPTGSMDLCELRNLIDFLHGDGVIVGYGDSFALTSAHMAGFTFVGTGAAVLDGVLSVHDAAESISILNGDVAIVVKQMHSNGRTQLTSIPYSDVGSTTCVPLWRCTVSGGAIVGTATWIGTPTLYNGIVQRHPTVMSITRVTSGSTTNASGEDADLETNITLETGVLYNVEAHASVISRGRHGSIAVKIDGVLGTYQSNGGDRTVKLANASSKDVGGSGTTAVQVFDKRETALTDWVLQATYGSFGSGTSPNFNTPSQVAVNSTGQIFVADTGNNRLVRLNSSGAGAAIVPGLTNIIGVCVDTSDNVYVSFKSGANYYLRKYNSSLVFQWDSIPGAGQIRHVATDGTYLFATSASNFVIRVLCSTGGSATTFGSAGSGPGQFNAPWGISVNISFIYVVDQGNTRVQKLSSPAGTYVVEWSTAVGCRGIAQGTSTGLFLACNTGNTIYHTTTSGTAIDSFSQESPDGIAVSATDVVWASNSASHNIAKWDEAVAFTWDSGLLVVKAVPRT